MPKNIVTIIGEYVMHKFYVKKSTMCQTLATVDINKCKISALYVLNIIIIKPLIKLINKKKPNLIIVNY